MADQPYDQQVPPPHQQQQQQHIQMPAEKGRQPESVPGTIQSPAEQKSHKVVGFFHQIWIIIWKNFLLFRRNLSGMFVEIFVSYVFLAILIFLRYFVDVTQVSDQNRTAVPPLAMMNITANRTNFYYYPNTTLIQTATTLAVNSMTQFFAALNFTFNATGNNILIIISRDRHICII
jgi:hypothetical protein